MRGLRSASGEHPSPGGGASSTSQGGEAPRRQEFKAFLRQIEPIGVLIAAMGLVLTAIALLYTRAEIREQRLSREATLYGSASERLETARGITPNDIHKQAAAQILLASSSLRVGQISILERMVELEISLEDLNARGVSLKAANLTGANLRGAHLRETILWNVNLASADLTRANVTDAILWGADLTDAVLVGTQIPGAKLTRAFPQTDAATLRDANLEGAFFWIADLTGADLTGANLTGAVLEGANFTGTNLTRADLTRASFEGPDPRAPYARPLLRADLTNANLTDAKGLTQEQLDSACGDSAPLNLPPSLTWRSSPCHLDARRPAEEAVPHVIQQNEESEPDVPGHVRIGGSAMEQPLIEAIYQYSRQVVVIFVAAVVAVFVAWLLFIALVWIGLTAYRLVTIVRRPARRKRREHDLHRIENETYDSKHQSELQPGDIVLHRDVTNKLWDGAIAEFTRSPYCHVDLYYGNGWSISAELWGVKARPWDRKGRAFVDVFRHPEVNKNENRDKQNRILGAATSKLGAPYELSLLSMFPSLSRPQAAMRAVNRAIICSELVSFAFKEGNLGLVAGDRPVSMHAPADIARSKHLCFVGSFHGDKRVDDAKRHEVHPTQPPNLLAPLLLDILYSSFTSKRRAARYAKSLEEARGRADRSIAC